MRKASVVVLSYPPVSSVWHLPMGIGYLAGVLTERGHRVCQEYGYIKAPEYVLRHRGGASIEAALSIIRSPDSTITERYDARILFEEVSGQIESQIETFVVERNNLRCPWSRFKGDIDELDLILKNCEEHVFYDYFANVEVPRAAELRPAVYGISISDERQLVSGCILASMIKQAVPGVRVIMGGNYWARVMDAYADPRFARLFDHWDAIVYSEGFQPVVSLVEGELATAPGVVWRDGDVVRVNPRPDRPTSFDALPVPIFDRQTPQWSADFVPPLYTTSNCHMRCSFCAIAAGSDTFLHRPRMMSPARVAEHMVALGASRFDIVDEFLPIARQLELGRELARLGHRAEWQCYMTASDKLVNPDVCAALAEAGCRGVQLGLESLDPDILRQEAKVWNHPRNYGRILKNLYDAGIQTHVFIIVGVPNEPISWSIRWLAFLEQFGDYILTIKSSRYRLARRAPDENAAYAQQLAGIKVSDNDSLLLNLNRDQFTYTTHGLSRKRVEGIRDLLEEACRRHWAYQVTSTLPWWVNRGRYTLAELRAQANTLTASRPPEPLLPEKHLKRALTKTASAVSEDLGDGVRFASYDEARSTAHRLLGDLTATPGSAQKR
jgi:Radical SAM superfamily